MKKIDKIKLSKDATIREAFVVIEDGAMKVALVVDEDNRLVGTVTDGDIRRGMLDGMSIDDSIESIIFRTPTVCRVTDSKESIIQTAIKRKFYQIPIVDDEDRLVGIEEIDELVKSPRRSNRVVLMAGGLGKRLGELTQSTPKPMLHVGNKPILETIIENFAKHGFTNIILSVNHLSYVISDYFGDGSDFGVSIEYVHEAKRMGTAGSLGLMRKSLTEPFFVMNSDLLTNINYEHLHDYHIAHNAVGTMGVREYDFQVPYGVVNINNGNISSIDEKPIHKFFVSAGVYMISPEVLDFIPNDQFFDMPSLFEKMIGSEMKTISFPIREYWLDIGRLNDFKKANDDYFEVFDV